MSAWDDAGFQDEVLKMTESVIKAENATARHDLIAKVAPLVDCCDENRLYSNYTLLRMKQIIQEDVSLLLTTQNFLQPCHSGGDLLITDRFPIHGPSHKQ